jgi:hypothetical protein
MSALSMPEQVPSPSKSSSDEAAVAAGAAGAPIPRDAIDPDLIKLRRPAPKVGMITAAGIVLLCIVFWFRLADDRAFGGSPAAPRTVAIGDVLAGKVATEQLISLTAEPLMAHAVRAATNKVASGLRVVPARGSGDRLWLVLSGDAADAPVSEAPIYSGRLRPLEAMPFAKDIGIYLTSHPRPVFAPPAAVRAAIASNTLRTVTGDELALHDSDELAVDVIDLGASTLAATINERFPTAAAWNAALAAAGLTATQLPAPQTTDEVIRYSVAVPATAAAAQLEKAGLWAARIEPVLRSHRGTWAQLKTSTAEALTIGATVVPDVQIDLIGVLVARGVPEQAYALVSSELPADYWYVRPISIALLVLGALFAWVLVRAVRRALLPPRQAR